MTETAGEIVAESNIHAYTVSELAFALKRTIEDAYGFVRLRGELSKVTFHGNGHVYLDIKDDKACISGVIWRTQAQGLAIRPQSGMEVIVTGRVTTYPGRSQYQIIIETLAPAGVGALLAQLERLKAKLTAEGLFESARKSPLPSTPGVIGVITSPTGAVIRDILHRIRERWPCRVIVWPVVVQGDQAAVQVRAAIEGFNALPSGAAPPRPDLIIVARGGGSVEDLWAFNDEALARAAAASAIPLISAVGHETDTTLIDFASDRRAPTPTAAAEIATPVMSELAGALLDYERRLVRCASSAIDHRRSRLAAAAGNLPRPVDLLALARQRLDIAAGRLGASLLRNVAAHRNDLTHAGSPIRPLLLQRSIQVKERQLSMLTPRLRPAVVRTLTQARAALTALEKLRLSLDPDRPLSRGFARVARPDGRLVSSGLGLRSGEALRLTFHDATRDAVVARGRASLRPAPPTEADQGDLF